MQLTRRATVAISSTLLLAWLAGNSLGGNWPRYRGPNGTARASSPGLPTEWREENILWKTELPGIGISSPAVWDDRVFVTGSADEGVTRLVLCYDAKTGKELWRQQFEFETHKKHKKNSFATETPATDGTYVFVPFSSPKRFVLFCFTVEGKLVWQQDLGPFAGDHGSGASPILYKDKVIQANDQEGESFVVALSKETGAIAWTAPRPSERTAYSTPFLYESNGKTQVILSSMQGITSIDADTGKQLWICDVFNSRAVACPFQAGELVLASCGSGNAGHQLIAVKPDGSGDVSATHKVWELTKTLPYCPTPLAMDDHIFMVTDGGVARCIQTATGEDVWTERLSGKYSTSPFAVDNRVFMVSEDGNVSVLAAEPKFRLLAKNKIDDFILTNPAVADNRVYIRGEKYLWCVGPRE